MERSHFNGVQMTPDVEVTPRELTICYLPIKTEKGVVMVKKCLEHELSKEAALDYADYSINALLAAGINPKQIHLTSDIRIGSDKDIEKFNNRVDELAEQMFND